MPSQKIGRRLAVRISIDLDAEIDRVVERRRRSAAKIQRADITKPKVIRDLLVKGIEA